MFRKEFSRKEISHMLSRWLGFVLTLSWSQASRSL